MTNTIEFCGAAGTVTGSCSLVRSGEVTFLVDCGLFQGNRTTEQLNEEPFPFDVADVDFVLLTHAHIDHSGLLPKLAAAGYRNKIYATPATCDLLTFMLPDSAFIQENNAERRTKKNRRRGREPVDPLYTLADAQEILQCLTPVQYEVWATPDAAGADSMRCRFWNAGHLLGSASIEIELTQDQKTTRLLFSGDLGPQEKAFHLPPDGPSGYDYVICESTYGGRDRVDYTLEVRREAIRKELIDGLARGGNVVIPSFAVERSQELLHDIAVVLGEGHLPDATVYVDSPLARKATQVFIQYADQMDDIAVPAEELFRHERFRLIESVEQSKQLNEVRRGAIIVSASGMCTAGRIKHHLKNNIHRGESTILFVGYQSPGTLGHIITSGADAVRIHGKEYVVRAAIRRIGNYSAHADGPELVRWIKDRLPIGGGIFLNHGEDDSRSAMKEELVKAGIDRSKIQMPGFQQRFRLEAMGTAVVESSPAAFELQEIREDWNQRYARFMLDLSKRLETMDSAGQRSRLLEHLHDQLDG